MNKTHMDKKLNQLPTWLWANSATLPPIYKIVWEAVREDKTKSNGLQTEVLVDTNKVFPLLLTSQLSMEVLGHIWNLANQKYAGQLTEQELYIVLALVAAAQASYTFNSLDILHLLPFPPIPYLNIECVLNVQSTMHVSSASKYPVNKKEEPNIKFLNFEEKYLSEVKGKTNKVSQLPFDVNLPSNVVAEKAPYLDGETSTVMINSTSNNYLRDHLKYSRSRSEVKNTTCTLDSNDDFSDFQSAPIINTPSISSWDMKQGSAIGSRLANHNLGVKKSVEKPKKNNTNLKTINFPAQAHTSLSSLNSVSQNLSLERLSELFPKCAVKNQSKTVILKDTVIRNNDLSKDSGETTRDLKTDVIDNIQLSNNKPVTGKQESIEKLTLLKETKSDPRDLMNLQSIEDKYSALRALVNETSVSNKTNSTDSVALNDEFGEFVSAEQSTTDTNTVLDNPGSEYFGDTVTGFESKSFNSRNDNSVTSIDIIQDISQSLNNIRFEDNIDEQKMNEKIEPRIEPGKIIQMEDAISLNSIELVNGMSDRTITRSGSVPSLDLKSFLPLNAEEDQMTQLTQQTVYWEWKQYMESCISLLQIAASIFINITSEVVLNEVLNSAQGYNFLCNLAEVAAVCRRVNFSYKEMDINIIGFDDLLMDIDKIWAEMEPFYSNIPIVTELPAWPLHQGECVSCALCLTVITSDKVIYNENNYHVTCANLWLNCVNSQLPAIQYPTFYSFTNVCSANNHV
ncbi:hypothetical protein KPH14_001733 [Odynerus spinipes]|uniref:EH domain-containing protein n=1 Tax=Odynerus spinipes TaxID=1348599 RepID=A0AAD9RZM1_9HYME|nr:hypothetical protein KPH14_001733 [Odynerus spinipes]